MKYLTIYEQIMQSELKTAEYESYKNNAVGRINDEWLAILAALRYPKSHPREMMERMKEEFDISYEMLIRCLRSVNLDDPGKRCYICAQIEKAAEDLKGALRGEKESAIAFADFTSNMTERDNMRGKMYFKAKYLLVYLIWMDDELANREYTLIARCYGERYCERVLRQLKKEINRNLGVKEEKKTAKDVLQKTEAVLASTERDYDVSGTDSDELAKLRFLNENYRNSLEMVQAMFDELKESVEESAEEAKKVAVSDFFGKLNSPAYGSILDSLLVVEKNLAQARKEGIKMPPQLMSLTIIFKQLIRFVKDSGIEPIEEVGREFEAVYEEISLLNYIGEPYERDEEVKKLRVSTPGWKYGDMVISTPTVQEVTEE